MQDYSSMLSLKLIYQVAVFLVLFMAAHAVSVPDPIALYPLNSKYETREINNRQPQGTPVGVSLAAGPNGEAGGSYQFAGQNNSYIEFPNNGGLEVQRSITMLCWINPQKLGGPIFYYNDGKSAGIIMSLVPLGRGALVVNFVPRGKLPEEGTFLITYGTAKPNQWQYVGASYDYDTGNASLWVNGDLAAQQNIGAGITPATQGNLRMGVADRKYFKGRVSAMQVFDVALTPEQVIALMKNASQDIKECETLNPCQNGGECKNTPGSYECTCKPGFTGSSCETDIDECSMNSVVCFNGGKCVHDINSYKCDCEAGYIGQHCEWEKQGCWKDAKYNKKKAMGKVYAKFRNNKGNVQAAVEDCLKSAEEKQLQIFGIRNKYTCATTKGSADFRVYGPSTGCKEQGDYGVGLKMENYVYILKKEK
ncbi:hypothetical protein ACROYT_G027975 [Oculina patagonica]